MAASIKQIEANRQNAKKSTGPRTSEGKARASLNSIRHGMAAGPHTVLPHENRAEYDAMRTGLIESWQPANAQELQLVEAIAGAWLRMERAMRFEAALFEVQTSDLKRRRRKSRNPDPSDDHAIAVNLGSPEHELAYRQLFRYQQRAESAYHRAIETLRKVRNDRRRQEHRQAQTVARPSRYVTIRPEKRASSAQTAQTRQRMASLGHPSAQPRPQLVTPAEN